MTNKYMYFIANWKMFGSLNSLNSLHKVVKFFKGFKKNKFAKNTLAYSCEDKRRHSFSYIPNVWKQVFFFLFFFL